MLLITSNISTHCIFTASKAGLSTLCLSLHFLMCILPKFSVFKFYQQHPLIPLNISSTSHVTRSKVLQLFPTACYLKVCLCSIPSSVTFLLVNKSTYCFL